MFSSRYDGDQQSGHRDAVSLFERYTKGADDPRLKDWADKTLPRFGTIWIWPTT